LPIIQFVNSGQSTHTHMYTTYQCNNQKHCTHRDTISLLLVCN